MKNVLSCALFGMLAFGTMFFALGCEERVETDNVDDFFDGRDVSSDTSIPTKRPEEPGPAGALILSPGSTTISNNFTIVVFTLENAEGKVTWAEYDSAKGKVLSSSSTAATYERRSAGDNFISATDAAGRREFAVIKQP